MTPERWARIKEIFADALDLAPEERESFVRAAASGDEATIVEVQRLLAESERETSLLSRPVVAFVKATHEQADPRFQQSTVLARRFRIVRFISHGGMGEVYEAEDLELGEHVALKAIRPGAAPTSVMLELFKSEVQLARRVTHPNVCRIYDLAQHEAPGEDPVVLLSMELLAGQTLAAHLKQNGPFTWKSALPLIEQIGAGIQAAHDAGIIHGDLKPANVMLIPGGAQNVPRAVVMDFGLAIPAAQAGERHRRGGTPGYLAPEQVSGEPLTTATDVFAFGAIIAEMLGAGHSLQFSPDSAEMPASWVRVLERCFEQKPEHRYAQPVEVVNTLRQALDGGRTLIRRMAIAIVLVIAAAVGLALARKWTAGKPALQQLFAENLNDEEVSRVSPNGRWLAEVLWDTGDLAIRDVSNGKIRRLTHKQTPEAEYFGGARYAVFSPDSRRIVYLWRNSRTDTELRIIGTDGKGERVLYKPGLQPLDWSPDGSGILVGLTAPSHYGIISVADGSLTLLTGIQPARTGRALFSPDGRSIVFGVGQKNKQPGLDIHRVSLTAGSPEASLIEHPANDQLIGWSPDRRLVFSSNRSGKWSIWVATVSDRGVEGEPVEIRPGVGNIDPLGMTRDGSLYYRLEGDTKSVHTAELDLAAGRTISPPKPIAAPFTGNYEYPNWSDDGSRLVFNSEFSPELGVYTLGNSELRMIPLDLSYVWRAQWYVKGTAIVAPGMTKDEHPGQFRIDPVTGASTMLIDAAAVGGPGEGVWSVDGSILFNRNGVPGEIVRLNVKTGGRSVLYTPAPGVDLGLENLALSPDGRTLAFQARNDAARISSLVLIPADGGEAHTLLTISRPEVFKYGSFTWTPDSKQILAARTRGEVSEIWRVPVDGSPPAKIDFPSMSATSLRLNRDGKTIAFTDVKHRSEIWVLESFLK